MTKFPSQKNKELFRTARNLGTKELKRSKIEYEKKLASEIKTNTKAYSQSKRACREGIGSIKHEKEIIADPQEICNLMNIYFTSIFTLEDTNNLPEPRSKLKADSKELEKLMTTEELILRYINT